MNILSDIKSALATTGLPVETGVYTGAAKKYIVITPLQERNDDTADDADLTETAGADVNLYYDGNYQAVKKQIKTLLKSAGFFIPESRWIEHDKETKQHHYVITVEKKEVL